MITAHAEPEHMADFEAFLKQTVAAAVKVGAPQPIAVYQAVMGAPLGTYMVVTGFNKWDELDAWMSTSAILTKAHGEQEGPKILLAGRGLPQRDAVLEARLHVGRRQAPVEGRGHVGFARVGRDRCGPCRRS